MDLMGLVPALALALLVEVGGAAGLGLVLVLALALGSELDLLYAHVHAHELELPRPEAEAEAEALARSPAPLLWLLVPLPCWASLLFLLLFLCRRQCYIRVLVQRLPPFLLSPVTSLCLSHELGDVEILWKGQRELSRFAFYAVLLLLLRLLLLLSVPSRLPLSAARRGCCLSWL